MNKLEKPIYELLEKYPELKKIVRNVYQLIFSFFPIRNFIAHDVSIMKNHFFGFHDITPWSFDNKYILTHKNYTNRTLNNMPIEIGIIYGDSFNKYSSIGKTHSWNFQQGSRLQWVGPTYNIAFNDFNGKNNYSKITTIEGDLIATFEKPIYIISSSGQYALSYSFERLKKGLPGYEYFRGQDCEAHFKIPPNDGLYMINIKNQNILKLFSTKDIVNYKYETSFKNSYHYLSHCLFSPCEKRIVFFHRWLTSSNVLKTRMISCNMDGSDLHVFPTNGMVSHICWFSNDCILGYASTKPFGRNYYMFTDKTDEYCILGKNEFSSDGHPHVSKDKKWMITDTYPDRYRRQCLILYNIQRKKCYKLARLHIPFYFRDERRCDFHPRWDYSSRIISFDAILDGIRSQCTMNLPIEKYM